MVYLCMCGVHYCAAVVSEQWPPELVLTLKEAKTASSVRNIKMLNKYGFGVVNSGISVIRTFLLIQTLRFLELAKGVQIIEVGLYVHSV